VIRFVSFFKNFNVRRINSHPSHLSKLCGTKATEKADLVATSLKLIHSGKILKDDDTISACGIKENDFLVVMVTKVKKAPPPKIETAPAAATPTVTTTEAVVPATETATPTNADATAAVADTPAPTTTAATAPAAPRPVDAFPDDVVSNLTSMGFPEAEVRHCLRAAHGNPDIAVEFLTNGIPDGVAEAAELVNATTAATPVAATRSSTNDTSRPLQALRNHPQFDALRRLVQSNPAALQQVLIQIGQQQPDLLTEINENQAAFLEMMNEPVSAVAPSAGSASAGSSVAPGSDSSSMIDGLGGSNPAQMAHMIQNMTAEELQQMAAMMGISSDQLRETAEMIGRMPPDQLNQFMMQFMAGDGMMGGGGGGGGGGGAGQHVVRLTEEEMAAVNRLTEMGFDRSEAAQAFLACDKNEALAANLLMDSMANGGFFGGDGGNDDGDQDDDDDDNMYD
jgi:UV excision repair protein RAD23